MIDGTQCEPDPDRDDLGVTLFQQVIAVCEQFEEAFQRGLAPRIEDYLGSAGGEVRARLFLELVMTEQELFRKAGLAGPTIDELRRRFPEFSASIVKSIATRAVVPSTSIEAPRDLPDIPGYEMIEEVGQGMMGVVYKARQIRLNRICAVKMIRHTRSEAAARFLTEAEAVARLRHPGIVQLYSMGDHQGQPFLEMEYIDGGTLAQSLDGTPMSVRSAAGLIELLALAAAEAHRQKVIHRDLKPGNVLLTRDKRPMIADFGLAKCAENGSGLTRTDSVLGTPSYMAPEQADGRAREAGAAADVYSLGAIFYELLTGRPPFRAATVLQTLEQVKNAEPVPPSRLQPGLSLDAETICLKCLDKAPASRYASARELAEDLRRFLDRKPILARRIGFWGRSWRWCRRRPAIAALGAALGSTVAVAFTTSVILWQRAERSAQEARHEHRQSSIESARRALELGVENCEKEEIGRGLLWMARSLKLAPPEAGELRRAIRAKLAHWGLGLAPLERVIEHPHEVNAVKFSPDGARLLTAMGIYYDTRPHSAQLWNPATGEAVGPPLRHQASVGEVDFSPDSRILFTSSRDGFTASWDAADGHLIRQFAIRGGGVRSRPGGRAVAICDGQRVQVVSLKTGLPMFPQATGNRGDVMSIDWSPDGRLLATATKAGTVGLWDAADGRLIRELAVERGYLYSVRFSPDGTRLIAGGCDQTTHLFDVATGRQISTPTTEHRDTISVAVYHPGGLFIAAGGFDGEARVVNVSTGDLVAQPLLHGTGVIGMDFSPDGRTLATASWDRMVRLWALPVGYTPACPPFGRLTGNSATFSHDGDNIIVAQGSSARRFAPDGTPAGPELSHGADVHRVLKQPTDDRVIVTIGRETARLWDTTKDEPLAGSVPMVNLGSGPHPGITSAAFSPDGRTLLTGGADRIVRRWDAATGRPLGVLLKADDILTALVFSPDGRTVLTGDWQGHVRRWDAATGEPLGPTLQHGFKVVAAAFSPDGKFFLTGSLDGTAQLWDTQTGRRFGPALAHRKALTCVAFDPTGRAVAAASQDSTVRLWDVATGTPLGPPIRHPSGPVCSLEFRPDGAALLTVAADGTVLVWPLPEPPADDPERVARWAKVVTGLDMDDDGVISPLRAGDWSSNRRDLEALGGSPFPTHHTTIRDWHVRQASLAVMAGDAYATRWHLAHAEGQAGAGFKDPVAHVWMTLGAGLLARGDASGSAQAFGAAARLRPDDADAQFWLGVARWNGRDVDGALKAFRAAISLRPDFARAHEQLGLLLLRGGAPIVRPEAGIHPAHEGSDFLALTSLASLALPPLEDAARALPKSVWIRLMLAAVRQRSGNIDGAIAAYREVLQLDPDHARAHLGLAAAIREREGRGGARSAVLQQALAETHRQQALATLATLDAAVRLNPVDAQSWNARAWFLATCADPSFRDGRRAVQDARRACDLSSWKNAAILDTLASAYAETGDFAEAMRWQTKAVELSDLSELRERLALFQKSRPFHQIGRTAAPLPSEGILRR